MHFIARLTGNTDEMVAGQAIELDEVARFPASASLVIAHNARFDRPCVETLHPGFGAVAWCRDLPEDQVDAVMKYLNQEVYPKAVVVLPMDRFDARSRYSRRV